MISGRQGLIRIYNGMGYEMEGKMNRKQLEELLEQERTLVFDRFTDEDAWTLGSWMVEQARARKLPIAIDITRNGHRLFHYAFDSASPDNEHWIAAKAAVVQRIGHSSFYVGGTIESQEAARLLPMEKFAAHGGAFPIFIRNVGPVGHVAVSGLPSADDHAFVVESLRMLKSSHA